MSEELKKDLKQEHYDLLFDRVQRFNSERELDWETIKKQDHLIKDQNDEIERLKKDLADAENRLKDNQKKAGSITGNGNKKYKK